MPEEMCKFLMESKAEIIYRCTKPTDKTLLNNME